MRAVIGVCRDDGGRRLCGPAGRAKLQAMSDYPHMMSTRASGAADGESGAGDPLLSDLTEPQIEAVTHVDGPLLVLAGPGSGKTRVITRRIAHLVLRVGIAPWNVLAITFTNKAAGEMRDRVAELVSARQARAITIATFHSLCARLLREYAERLGLPPGYSIYDTADQKRAMKQVLNDLEINSKNFPPATMLATISNAKNELLNATAYEAQAKDFYTRTVAKVYKKYEQTLERNQALDFDDLLLKTVELLKKHPDVLAELRARYQYVLIDEYQDTNHAQFMIANALASGHQNLCATGDPDQSIYGWRGANIRNILDFESQYSEAKVVRLEQNYRSTRQILAAADALIQHNSARKHKTLWTENDHGEPVTVMRCRDERHEAARLVRAFEQMHDQEQVGWGQMAVFYRINSLSRVIEDAFRDAGIPYQIARGTAFYDRKEIKDAVAYLRVVANPADEVNLLRVINNPTRGISDKTIKAMQAYALANVLPMDSVIGQPQKLTAITSRAQNAVGKFGSMVDAWRKLAGIEAEGAAIEQAADAKAQLSLRGFVERVLRDSGLEAFYRNDKSDPDQERLANLGELVTSAQQFEESYALEIELDGDGHTPDLAEKLLAFLERISLVADVDSVDPDQGAVTLMTLHAAKGLEFPVVAMVGVEDGMLPHERAQREDDGVEEERRLCFVGMTRAMRRLVLSYAKYRTVFGQTAPTIPSRFLQEIPEDVVEAVDAAEEDGDDGGDFGRTVGGGVGEGQRRVATKEALRFPVGSLVRHPQFGLGRVKEVTPMGAHTRAKVDFNTAGRKTLILQYARLERAD